jgi:hypothetical protein
VEPVGSKFLYKEIPQRYSEMLSAYREVKLASAMDRKAESRRVVPFNQEFSFYRVIGVHGNEMNTNGDMFEWGEKTDPAAPELLRLDQAKGRYIYQTFVGKGNYKDHKNDSVSKAVGILLDAEPNHSVKGIELVVAVDKQKDPMLIRGIDGGYITDVSMGARVTYSLCSICGSKAYTEKQFCGHIRDWKGRDYSGADTGWISKKAFEINRGVEFIELSWVTVGADTKAKFLEKLATANKARGLKAVEEALDGVHSQITSGSKDWSSMEASLDEALRHAILV